MDDTDDFRDATHIRFGKAACARCGHHPIMHMNPETILDGVPRPCVGAEKDGSEPACTCMAYVRSEGDEQPIIPIVGGSPHEVNLEDFIDDDDEKGTP